MRKTYLHPLDYPLGLKHYLTEEYLPVEYSPNPEVFIVEELIDLDSLHYMKEPLGEYLVYRITKWGVDTWRVLREYSRVIGVPENNVLFMGLKDRDSTSIQYFFVKRSIIRSIHKEYIDKSWTARLVGSVRSKPTRRILRGNRFIVVINGVDDEAYYKLKNLIEKIRRYGLPSYYGYQRFGTHRFNTHLIGKYILLNRLDYAIDELLYRLYPGESLSSLHKRINRLFNRSLFYEYMVTSARKPGSLRKIFMESMKGLFIDAYQSYLYNHLLSKLIDRYGWSILDKDYPVPGCRGSGEYYSDILFLEGVPSRVFEGINRCWYRRGLFYPRGITISRSNDTIHLGFILDKGLYASIVLREIFKSNLHL